MTTAENTQEATQQEERPAFLQIHFDNAAQQQDAAKLGMWIFLTTEILMFSGLFLAYFFLRYEYPDMVLEAHEHLDKVMGGINTVVLLGSSLTMALAIRSLQLNKIKQAQGLLFATLAAATLFLVIKYFEYQAKFEHGTLPGPWYAEHIVDTAAGVQGSVTRWFGGANLFFGLYFVMTGIHAIHVMIGMGLITWLLVKNARGRFSADYYTPVEGVGLYWHLVDLIWIFAFPLLYLVK